MTDLWTASAEWLGQTALVGGIVLLTGWLIARRAAPAVAQAITGWSVRGAVVAAGLCLLPGWLTLPAPDWARPAAPARDVASFTPATPLSTELVSVDVITDEPEELPQGVVVSDAVFVAGLPKDNHLASPVIREPDVKDQAIVLAPPALLAPAPAPETAASAANAPPISALLVEVAKVILVAYGIGLILAGGQLLLAQVSLARIVAAAAPAPRRVQDLFEEASESAGVPARLLLSNRVSSPVCFGLFRPTVVLPKFLAQTAYDNELRWIFAHELDHLRRGDHRLAWWVGLGRALYFFLPVFWAVRRLLGLSQEYLADAAAAAANGRPADYAAFLVTLSTHPADRRLAQHPLTATGVRAGRSDLFRRVSMLVNANGDTPRRASRRWSLLAAGGTMTAAVMLSGIGFAKDDERIASKITEAAAVAEDDAAQKRADEARARAEQARKRAEAAMKEAQAMEAEARKAADAARKDGEKAKTEKGATARVLETRVRVNEQQIEELKKAIEEAAKKGDMDAVRKTAEKLAGLAKGGAAAAPRTMTLTGQMGPDGQFKILPVPAVPGTPAVPAIPNWSGKVEGLQLQGQITDKVKQGMERGLKQMHEALEKLKDNPEAQAELKKAIETYHKAMQETMKSLPNTFQFQNVKPPPAAPKAPTPPSPAGKPTVLWRTQDGDAPKVARVVEGHAMAAGSGGRLGVHIEPVPAVVLEQLDLGKDRGVMVVEVIKESPAAKAGIKANDIIIELAGKPVTSDAQALVQLVGKLPKDEKVDIVILRKGKKETIKGVALPEARKMNVRVLPKDGVAEVIEDFKLIVPEGTDPAKIKEQVEKLKKELHEKIKDGKLHEGDAKLHESHHTMSVQVNDGEYTIKAEKDGVKYDITGTADGVSSITIKDGDKISKAKSLDTVPEKYRADVKKMIGSVKIVKE